MTKMASMLAKVHCASVPSTSLNHLLVNEVEVHVRWVEQHVSSMGAPFDALSSRPPQNPKTSCCKPLTGFGKVPHG